MKLIIRYFVKLNERLKKKKGLIFFLLAMNVVVWTSLFSSLGLIDFLSSIYSAIHSVFTFFWVDLFHESIKEALIAFTVLFFVIMFIVALMRIPLIFTILLNKD